MPTRRVKAGVAFALGVVLLIAIVWYVGIDALVTIARDASPGLLVLAFVAYAAFFLARGVRWRMLLSRNAPDVSLRATTSLTAIGWLANSILPLKGGDVLRAAILAKRERLGFVPTTATVALERVLDLLGLALLAAVGLLLIPRATELPSWLAPALQAAWILPLLGIATLLMLVRFRKPSVRAMQRWFGGMGKLGPKLVDVLDTTLAGLAALLARPKLMLALAPVTLIVVTLQALVFTFLAMSLLSVPLVTAFAGATLFLLSFVISVTPGNVGTYEAAFVAIFVALGVGASAAMPAAILTHVITTLFVATLGGAAMLLLGPRTSTPILQAARAPSGGSP